MKKIFLFLLLLPFTWISCVDKGFNEGMELTTLVGTHWEFRRTNGYIEHFITLTFGEENVTIREFGMDPYEILWSTGEEAPYFFDYPYVDIYTEYGIMELTIEANKFMVTEPDKDGYIDEYVRK